MCYTILSPKSNSATWMILNDRNEVVFTGHFRECESWLDLDDRGRLAHRQPTVTTGRDLVAAVALSATDGLRNRGTARDQVDASRTSNEVSLLASFKPLMQSEPPLHFNQGPARYVAIQVRRQP